MHGRASRDAREGEARERQFGERKRVNGFLLLLSAELRPVQRATKTNSKTSQHRNIIDALWYVKRGGTRSRIKGRWPGTKMSPEVNFLQ